MSTHLVSLISDYLCPNYLLIKEMKGRYNDLLFTTTEKNKRNFQINTEIIIIITIITIFERNYNCV